MRNKGAWRGDLSIAQIAFRQHGVVTSRQLEEAGFTRDAIRRRALAGRLHRVHHGVYAVGHRAMPPEGRWIAAVLACGPDAVLSHRSAASLWRLLPPASGPVDVTIPGLGGRRGRRGICIHRSETLTRNVTSKQGISVTRPARTIADLGRVVGPSTLRKAIRAAAVEGFEIALPGSEPTRSELEDAFLRLCRRHRLPMPDTNVRVGAFLVDFAWSEGNLIVETDGYRYHRGPQAFEEDRARDVELRLLGYEVLGFTFQQVTRDPTRVAKAIRALLRREAH